eukprot:CAMPEP_0117648478 /NCGR_PEP_ID=MMETSP0804-20121206/427_1 /TAXON_ID=1074897 /ORGANISM="Tetraselmis astigmatica, Strain CCMP880" /LENGTH=362 /DNA_ID=CAMNT_0005454085 /DNA_START=705 /DNA_END=1793 /DNA_ORIENTATION=+
MSSPSVSRLPAKLTPAAGLQARQQQHADRARNLARSIAAPPVDASPVNPGPTSWAAEDGKPRPSFSNGHPVTVLPPRLPPSDNIMAGEAGAYSPQDHHLEVKDLWPIIKEEAWIDSKEEQSLASALHSSVVAHNSLDKSMAFVLANKLQSPTLLGTHLMQMFQDAYEDDKSIMEACAADINAVYDRDPACDKYSHCILNFKGFQAIQAYRVAHWLWQKDRKALARALQSRISEKFHVDIHPGAKLGRGMMIDHATGVVIGETAVVGDNVSILHHVTLGGSGTDRGVRHPRIGNGVLLGAGVCCLGPITVGAGSKIGAGSLVVSDLPDFCVAVGVPARVLRRKEGQEPSKTMDQTEYIYDYII